jgi:septal ring factor EnvC (AmiA/AmiB activator)
MRVVLIFWLALASPLYADEVSPEQLEALRERIDRLQEQLNEERRERDSLQEQLRRTEKRIGEVTAQIRRLDRKREDTAQRLQRLTERRNKLARDKAEQIDWLARTARASYQSGRQPGLKLLLNQENPGRLSRLLRYQDYFQQSRSERVEVLNQDLSRLRELTRKVETTREELDRRRQAVEERREKLQQARAERGKALERINAELDRDREKLAQLREDEQRLQRLLDDMSESMKDIPAEPGGRPFGELTNELPWPVNGERRVNYGEPRQGEMRWKGVVLEANPGESVRAVQGGRVVYADWLRGYGLLTIVDHGGGYLSLYGYNQSLLRDVGEWVSTGDELALAGQSGGHDRTGVYFEIRHRGDPVDPSRWCNRRVTLPPLAEQ